MSIESLATPIQPYDFFGEQGTASNVVLERFYGYLPALKDRAALAATNQRLFQIFQTNVLWAPLLAQDFKEEIPKNSGPKGGYTHYKNLSQYHENRLEGGMTHKELLDCGKETCCFYKDREKLYTGSLQGEVKIWDLVHQKEILTLGSYSVPILKIQVAGDVLVALSINKEMRIWDLITNKELFSKKNVKSFQLDENYLYFQLDSQNQIKMFNLTDNLEQEAFEFGNLYCWTVFNGELYVNQERELTIQIFSVIDRKLIKDVHFPCDDFNNLLMDQIVVDQIYLYIILKENHSFFEESKEFVCQVWDISLDKERLHLVSDEIFKEDIYKDPVVVDIGPIYFPINEEGISSLLSSKEKTFKVTVFPINPQ